MTTTAIFTESAERGGRRYTLIRVNDPQGKYTRPASEGFARYSLRKVYL